MDKLKFLSDNDGTVIYEIEKESKEDAEQLKRYVISTKGTRKVMTDANITGEEYAIQLKNALKDSFFNIPSIIPKNIPDVQFNIINLLTGSEAWRTRQALNEAYKFNDCRESFIWKKRSKGKNEEWVTNHFGRKLSLKEKDSLIFADITATGISLKDTLKDLISAYSEEGSIERFIYITIGGKNAEDYINQIIPLIVNISPEFKKTIVIYFESRLSLVEEDSPIKIKSPGTDLILHKSLPTPDFLIEDYKNIKFVLEKCKAYYASARYSNRNKHFSELKEFWSSLKDLANDGFTLEQALNEKSFFELNLSKKELFEKANQIWIGVSNQKIEQLWESYSSFLDEVSKTSLRKVCENRIYELDNYLK